MGKMIFGAVVIFLSAVSIVLYRQPLKVLIYSVPDRVITSKITETKLSIAIPPLTIDQIFSPDHLWVKAIPSEQVVTIIATGDVIPARSVNQGMVRRNNFLWLFEKQSKH